jgi:hypothetical protein
LALRDVTVIRATQSPIASPNKMMKNDASKRRYIVARHWLAA